MHRLIYQLLEYERTLRNGSSSPAPSDRSSSAAEDEEEWSRRRQALDEGSQSEDDERESLAVRREAEALDKAMEDRRVARKSSASSVASTASSSGGVGMGPAWKSRYGGRRRAGSRASVSSALTTGSVLSEDLVEEDEEEELLGLGSAFDGKSVDSRCPSVEPEDTPRRVRVDAEFGGRSPFTPQTARPVFRTPRVPQSASATQTSFNIPPPPMSAFKASFDLPSQRTPKPKRRPAPLVSLLPPVPASPTPATSMQSPAPTPAPIVAPVPVATVTPAPTPGAIPRRVRTQSSRPTPPPLMLRTLSNTLMPMHHRPQLPPPSSGPSQTLFVFPPSPNNTAARTPSTMTLLSHGAPVPFPCVSPPRVATEKRHGRTRSFVALGVPPTPTTACSRVDARGWFGVDL